MKKYTGQPLGENEYLLKIREDKAWSNHKTGFLTKLTQKGEIPSSFESWGTSYPNFEKLPIFVFEEKFRKGWKLCSWRFGQSQNWASLITPEGFTLEIYLNQFLKIIQENTLVNGEIQGEFMWKKNELIKK